MIKFSQTFYIKYNKIKQKYKFTWCFANSEEPKRCITGSLKNYNFKKFSLFKLKSLYQTILCGSFFSHSKKSSTQMLRGNFACSKQDRTDGSMFNPPKAADSPKNLGI